MEPVGGARIWRGILRDGCVLDVDDQGKQIKVGFAGGTRVLIRVDDSLPSLVTSRDMEEIRMRMEGEDATGP